MPTTDHKRDERIHFIHKCLRNDSVRWSVISLHKRLNKYLEEIGGELVSRRTIAADLKYLELRKLAPVKRNNVGRNVYYYYEYDFELNQPIVNKDEYLSLIMAKEVLQQLKGFPLAQEFEKLIKKLDDRISDEHKPLHPYIIFESSHNLKNISILDEIFDAIKNKTVLKLTYRMFRADQPIEKIIHPYFLKQYNQRWFLFGWDETMRRTDNSPIDRIIALKPITKHFEENTTCLPGEYFNDIVGVTRHKSNYVETIRFAVSKERAEYILTKPFHHSLKEIKRQKNGDVIFQISVCINRELISLFLSFGKDISIQKPLSFKKIVKDELKMALGELQIN